MSKRVQPERAAKVKAPEIKSKKRDKKTKKEKEPKKPKASQPEIIPIKKVKVENSALDQLKTVIC